jgi:hypothetical protein|tara:strand:+ start:2160 stop:2477 length:318 start_codon:yes stop_codon:yes gene_type:complete
MSSSINSLLSGFTSTTYLKFNGRENNMFHFTTNCPELDKENEELFLASKILEKISNKAGLTTHEFYKELVLQGVDLELHENILLAAIAIETMLGVDMEEGYYTEH